MVAHVMLAAVQSGVTSDLALCVNRIKYSPSFLPSWVRHTQVSGIVLRAFLRHNHQRRCLCRQYSGWQSMH